jgi:hypothetical protein
MYVESYLLLDATASNGIGPAAATTWTLCGLYTGEYLVCVTVRFVTKHVEDTPRAAISFEITHDSPVTPSPVLMILVWLADEPI